MWRKNSKRSRWGSSRRRKLPASAIPKSIARVRKQRIVVFNTMQACEFTCSAWDPQDCKSRITFDLVTNSSLQTLFGDNCKVVDMRGGVWIDPWLYTPYDISANGVTGAFGDPAAWLQFFNLYSKTVLQGRAGLVRTQATASAPGAFLPDYYIDDSFDWGDGPWMKTWNHMWFMKENWTLDHMQQSAVMGICSDTSSAGGGSALNPLAGGTGNINTFVGPTSTVCTQVQASTTNGQPQRAYRQLANPRPWYISLNRRKPITLKENQALQLDCAFSSLVPGTDCFPTEADDCQVENTSIPCLMRLFPNVTMKIQYG